MIQMQIAGASYGVPTEWKSKLAKCDLIVQYADALLDLSESIVIDTQQST